MRRALRTLGLVVAAVAALYIAGALLFVASCAESGSGVGDVRPPTTTVP